MTSTNARTQQKSALFLFLYHFISPFTHELYTNFLPYFYHRTQVTKLLAAAATACHELVPPDAIEPLLRQLVTQFVHDKARPEVVAVGINSVREICNRTPLVMTEDLLRDLSQYKKAVSYTHLTLPTKA